ncbi:hypothetical protein I302_102037 [Kwoniella bestiolae CBS 10118]|uniref:Uncharacterized protein n=1 Tax=Kwoniella bestiolae CBS 10118 TaxID=1296100 RepID=A0A1B9GDY2_9TREE|nr:hypothetical protein I302_00722 [Kwoniella bestiolae CBS 10118]OCF29226.1 hypothetical protein I302_00722 [Kwoniella bestiolae CBS 10118]
MSSLLKGDNKIVFDGAKCYYQLTVGGPVSVYEIRYDQSTPTHGEVKKGDIAFAWFGSEKKGKETVPSKMKMTVYKPAENTDFQAVPKEGNYTRLTYMAGRMASYSNSFTDEEIRQGSRYKQRLSYARSKEVYPPYIADSFDQIGIVPGSVGLCHRRDEDSFFATMEIWSPRLMSRETILWNFDDPPNPAKSEDKTEKCPQNGNLFDSDIHSDELNGYKFHKSPSSKKSWAALHRQMGIISENE